MAFDSFIKIDGIPGESTDEKHKEWIEILSFDHHIEQPASSTASSVGGATAERVNHGTFNIVHQLDKATPKLLEACCTGKALKTTLWGYGSTTQAPSYPGRSFNVRRDVPITVR